MCRILLMQYFYSWAQNNVPQSLSAQAHQMSLSVFPQYTWSSAEMQLLQCISSVLV